jgi:PAS domain S-box-containing protein
VDDDRTLSARLSELEATLRETEARFRTVIEGAFEAFMLSVGGRVIECNAACGALVGLTREQVIGKTVTDFTTPRSAALIIDHIRSGFDSPYEAEIVHSDGHTLPCEIRGRAIVHDGLPARFTAIRDLTERKRAEAEHQRLEAQMQHAQKLETLAVLVGGMAHDFNNLLLVVQGHAELGLMVADESAPTHAHLLQIRDAALRAGDLVQNMLTYAGRAQAERETLDLGALVHGMDERLRAEVSKRAALVVDVEPGLPPIEADAGQLQQVLMALVTNASEALGDTPGKIELRVATQLLSSVRLLQMAINASLGAGRYVMIEVRDEGCGMDAATLARVFDPFFTTKFTGRGLGLASVLGIVRAHSGAIELQSEVGRGTRFALFFPLSAGRRSEPPPGRPARGEPGRRRLALLADDERMLRSMGAEILATAGFEVITAEDGQHALELFRARASEIDLVILDAAMPRMGGPETLAAIRALGANTPVILVSGFQDSDLGMAKDPQLAFLAKPFEIAHLLSTIDELLGR